MDFNPRALLLLVAFCLLLVMSLTFGSGWMRGAEATASVFIALSLFGFFRNGQRTRQAASSSRLRIGR
jgi:hypothetical protein